MKNLSDSRMLSRRCSAKPVGVYVKWDSAGNVARLTFISYHPEVAFQPLDASRQLSRCGK